MVVDGAQSVGEVITAAVGIEVAGDDWTGPEFTNELRSRIASVAATGKTTTEYAG